jgi:eukaryotic-like serine/threonine-protein kinase
MSLPRPEEAILDAALAKPRSERSAFVTQACAQDAKLLELVLALLRAHERGSAQPQAPAVNRPAGPVPIPASSSEKLPERVGRYKILQQVGEGGCGVVYMAEQEEPVRRRVALKVIKLGMDTKQVIARFEAERQALAMMDHPNIAKVLDAGATERGRPFFVMELVRGIKLTDYCDQNNLSTRQRLDLFIQVCKAIQHAHQKGIIHRDIKPSNILVTLHDGVPVPKVIDFGIAKAIEQRLTEKTLFTALEQFVGTPAYMSPEQAEMSGLDIDTRSDIYSLGVLLYELLTGKVPFEAKDLAAAGLAEMRRIIRERDPVQPSTRISTLTAAEQSTVARRRQVEPPKLVHLVRGDLDWIVMKCLDKDRTRRYETTNGLAMDILRHLDNEPVVACPASSTYRLRKLVRRNKLAFAATGAILGALLFGLAIAAWQFAEKNKVLDRAISAEQQALTEAAKGQQVAKFLSEMLEGVGPSVAKGRDITILKEILNKTSERVGRDLTNQPEAEMEIRRLLSRTYQDLDLFPEMLAMSRAAVDLGRKHLGEHHRETAAAEGLLGMAFLRLGQTDEAEKFLRQSLNGLERNGRSDEVAIALHDLGYLLLSQGKLEEAEVIERKALTAMKALWAANDPRIAAALPALAQVLTSRGKLREAESTLREALAIQQQREQDSISVAHILVDLANVLIAESKLDEALVASRTALKIYQQVASDQPDLIVRALMSVAGCLLTQGKHAEAEPLIRKGLQAKMNQSTNASPELATMLGTLAVTLSQHPEKRAEAESKMRQALVMNRLLLGDEHPTVALSLNNLAGILRDEGKLEEARSTYQQALDMKRKLVGNQDRDIHTILKNLGIVLRQQGKLSEAEACQRESLALCREQLDQDHPHRLSAMGELGQVLMLQGESKLPEAETLFREALEIRERKAPNAWGTFLTKNLLGGCLALLRKFDEAEPLLVTGYVGMKQREDLIPAAEKPRLVEAGTRVVQLYEAWGKPEQTTEWQAKLPEVKTVEPGVNQTPAQLPLAPLNPATPSQKP